MGTILALLIAPLIIQNLGWPSVFYIFGSLGLFWVFFWQQLVDEVPPLFRPASQQQLQPPPPDMRAGGEADTMPVSDAASSSLPSTTASPASSLSAAAEAAVEVGGDGKEASGSKSFLAQAREIPWAQFANSRAVWAILAAHSAWGVGHYITLSWLPTYFNQQFDIDVKGSAYLSLVPWLVMVLASNAAGWSADYLSNSGRLSMTNTRKLLQTVGSLGPAACLLYLSAFTDSRELDVTQALVLLTAMNSLGGLQAAGFSSNHQDIASKYAAVLFGLSNTMSSILGSASVYLTGRILDETHSWSAVFSIVAGCYVAGAAAYLAWGSAEQQFD